jgi:2-polyprenyl-3-methyl-5-hydroxy-6-metoxy-1,4-benzoquinol methylase
MTKLTTPEFWDKAYENVDFKLLPHENPIRSWIEKYVEKTEDAKTALEIGCYPGRYIEVLGALGYNLNGLDFNDNLPQLKNWLQSLGHSVDSFDQVDFFNYKTEEKFDIVCSFGFIEHFSNWEDVLKTHMNFVKKDGYLIIEVPNFRGALQYLLHFFLDNENLKKHHLPSMNPKKWKSIVTEAGFEIFFCDYMETFQFWHNNNTPKRWQTKSLKFISKKQKMISSLFSKPNSVSSPYIGLIAKKI